MRESTPLEGRAYGLGYRRAWDKQRTFGVVTPPKPKAKAAEPKARLGARPQAEHNENRNSGTPTGARCSAPGTVHSRTDGPCRAEGPPSLLRLGSLRSPRLMVPSLPHGITSEVTSTFATAQRPRFNPGEKQRGEVQQTPPTLGRDSPRKTAIRDNFTDSGARVRGRSNRITTSTGDCPSQDVATLPWLTSTALEFPSGLMRCSTAPGPGPRARMPVAFLTSNEQRHSALGQIV